MSANTNLGAPCLHEGIDGIERSDSVGGINGDGRSPGVVAVEAIAGVEVDFGLIPGAEGEIKLWANDAIAFVSGVGGEVAADVEVEEVASDPEAGTEPIVHLGLVIEEEAVASHKDIILTDGVEPLAVLGEVEADVVDPVVTGLESDSGVAGATLDFIVPAMGEVEAGEEAGLGLFELVAADGIVKEIGEVGEEIEFIGSEPGVEPGGAVSFFALQTGGEAMAGGVAPGGGIDRAEAIDGAVGDAAGRLLVRRVPVSEVGESGDIPVVLLVAFVVAGEKVVAVVVVASDLGAVLVSVFQAKGEVSAPDSPRVGKDEAGVIVFAISHREESAREDIEELVVGTTRGGKVAVGCLDGAFKVI